MKKILTILLTVAIIASFGVALVACDKKTATTESISAEETEKLLFDESTGAVRALARSYYVTLSFTENKSAVERKGSATVTLLNERSLVYNTVTTTETIDGVNSVITENYYAGISSASSGSLRSIICTERIENGGTPVRDYIRNDSDYTQYNQAVTDSEMNYIRKYIVEEIYNPFSAKEAEISFAGEKNLNGNKEITSYKLTLNYNYLDGNDTVYGSVTFVLENKTFNDSGEEKSGLCVTSIQLTEGSWTYNASIVYGVEPLELPARNDWIQS